ncbi:hypothetical protein OXYTRIMIC_187 [Oxytricha trifallax]|uniref:Uncharacterized protein n=1 Tax=Oxytricha trifallax TaxID=1172189 RepID=A0A073HYL9_9SPIT|nr:hypothetical protein OXYTRIMIC_187 [Oxytricha trifallax]
MELDPSTEKNKREMSNMYSISTEKEYTQDSCGLTRIHYFDWIFKELIEIESMMRQPERLNRSDDLLNIKRACPLFALKLN